MIERVFADLERALRAHRPDDADRVLREIEVWRALSGRWTSARFEPGGPLSVPVSPGPCMEMVREAAFAFFPDRAAGITGAVARSLWPTGVRARPGSFFGSFRDADAVVAEPDRHPSLVVLGPPDGAREQLRILLESTELQFRPVVSIPLEFRIETRRVVAVARRKGTLRLNGAPADDEIPLSEGDIVTGEYVPPLLFLDRAQDR